MDRISKNHQLGQDIIRVIGIVSTVVGFILIALLCTFINAARRRRMQAQPTSEPAMRPRHTIRMDSYASNKGGAGGVSPFLGEGDGDGDDLEKQRGSTSTVGLVPRRPRAVRMDSFSLPDGPRFIVDGEKTEGGGGGGESQGKPLLGEGEGDGDDLEQVPGSKPRRPHVIRMDSFTLPGPSGFTLPKVSEGEGEGEGDDLEHVPGGKPRRPHVACMDSFTLPGPSGFTLPMVSEGEDEGEVFGGGDDLEQQQHQVPGGKPGLVSRPAHPIRMDSFTLPGPSGFACGNDGDDADEKIVGGEGGGNPFLSDSDDLSSVQEDSDSDSDIMMSVPVPAMEREGEEPPFAYMPEDREDGGVVHRPFEYDPSRYHPNADQSNLGTWRFGNGARPPVYEY